MNWKDRGDACKDEKRPVAAPAFAGLQSRLIAVGTSSFDADCPGSPKSRTDN